MADPTAYCTAAQIAAVAGEPSGDTKHATLLADMEPRVRAIIDNETRTWFIPKSKTIYVKAGTEYQNKIYLPAPLITLTSIAEEETALTADEYVIGPGSLWLEKGSGYWSSLNYEYSDSVLRYAIKIVGSFGWSTVPRDVEQLAAELCAILGGLKTKTFMTGDGISQTVNITTVPDYVRMVLGHHVNRRTWSGQQMRITDTA